MRGTTNIAIFYKGGILLGSDTRRGSDLSLVHDDYNSKIVRLNDSLFMTKCGYSGKATNIFITEICRMVTNKHTPETLANEAYKFLELRQISNVATLVVGYSGRVPEIYKVRWAPEIERVEFPNRDGVKRIDEFVAIGSGAPYALPFLRYAPDMPRAEIKSLVQDALVHASLRDPQTGGGIDLCFITEHGYTTEDSRVLNTYLERYTFYGDNNGSALLLSIPSSACMLANILISKMQRLLVGNSELKTKHCVGELKWFNVQYHIYRITLEGVGRAKEWFLAIQEESRDIEGPFPINDNVAGTWVSATRDELFHCFLCEDTEETTNYLLTHNPNNPYQYQYND